MAVKKSTLIFTTDFPKLHVLGEELLLIYDEILPQKSVAFKKWLKQFPLKYSVQAGESLKAVEAFPRHISEIVKLSEKASSRNLTLIVVGGGSVGDFGGFVASVLKRGVKLIHMPSTWLAAIDSAHGGKTALNVGATKNQIGTFYPAEKIVLVRSLLFSQPESRTFEGFGELLKISLISGGSLWTQLSEEKEVNSVLLWKYLAKAIEEKYKVVQRDPEEKSGYRHILNLGHTVGHILEVYHQLPHGIAVNYGLDFALRWSAAKKIMSSVNLNELYQKPVIGYLLSPLRDDLFDVKESVFKDFKSLLLKDKKKTTSIKLRFVFLKKPGQCIVQEVTVDEILMEICRQKEEELYD
ncbi:MAG: 3-dehydroquinate synthase family protein [Bdellovibrio sp.]